MNLTEHVAVIGATGSGKTGMLVGIIESALSTFARFTVLDVKGDLSRLADTGGFKVYAPGLSHGLVDWRSEDTWGQALALVSLLWPKSNPESGLEAVTVHEALREGVQTAEGLRAWLTAAHGGIANPKEQRKMAVRVSVALAHPETAPLLSLPPIPSPWCRVIYLAHLSKDSQIAVVAQVTQGLVEEAARETGSASLRHLLVLDEMTGFCPPSATPPSKRPLLTLAKKGRAVGFGCLFATQNPVDMDYTLRGNCGTVFVGRLSTRQDVANVRDLTGQVDVSRLERRQFVRWTPKGSQVIRSPDVTTSLGGPMAQADVVRLCEKPARPVSHRRRSPEVPEQASTPTPAPVATPNRLRDLRTELLAAQGEVCCIEDELETAEARELRGIFVGAPPAAIRRRLRGVTGRVASLQSAIDALRG